MIPLFTSGQDESILITGKNEEKSLVEWIVEVEQIHGIAFFFDTQQISQIKLTDSFENTPLNKCLDRILSDYQLNYIIIDNRVIISKEKIRTDLPIGYFDSQSGSDVLVQTNINIYLPDNTSIQNSDSLVTIGTIANQSQQERVILSGYIKSVSTGENVIGAFVFINYPIIGLSVNVN